MTHEEITDLLEMMSNAYPMVVKNITNPEVTIKAWELAFADEPADVIYKAARHHMNTNKFFPTVADIRGCINKGQMIYGKTQETAQPVIEAPEAPNKLISPDSSFCDLCGLCDIRDQSKCPCDF